MIFCRSRASMRSRLAALVIDDVNLNAISSSIIMMFNANI